MAANMRIFPVSLAKAVAQAIAAAPVGGKGQAGLAYLSNALGPNWRLSVRLAGDPKIETTTVATLAASNGVISLPGYSTLLAMMAGDINSPAFAGTINPLGWSLRLAKADGTVYVEGAVGPAGSAAPFKLTASPAPGKGFAAPQVTLRFDPAIDSQGDWLQLLRDSMATRSVTQRITAAGNDYDHIIAANGGPIPFPDSYAGAVSFKGMKAALAGRPTGVAGGDINFFTDGVNAGAVWGWYGARQGHTAVASKLRVSSMFMGVMSESTRNWNLVFKGMRGGGLVWNNRTNTGDYSSGQDYLSDPDATLIAPAGGTNYEMWPKKTVSNPGGYDDFFGKVDRTAIADMRTWVLGVKVETLGSDRANARYIGTIGVDWYRDDHAGRRYWPTGYWQYVADAGGAEWKDIRNDGQPQWIVAIGCFEISRSKGIRPPWGDYSGVWPYSSAPDYGPTWAEIVANPPPDYRTY